MAKPNFHDRSWQDIDWETWGPQFSIVDRASSIGERSEERRVGKEC